MLRFFRRIRFADSSRTEKYFICEKRKKLSAGGFLFFSKWCKIIHTEQKKGEWL